MPSFFIFKTNTHQLGPKKEHKIYLHRYPSEYPIIKKTNNTEFAFFLKIDIGSTIFKLFVQ